MTDAEMNAMQAEIERLQSANEAIKVTWGQWEELQEQLGEALAREQNANAKIMALENALKLCKYAVLLSNPNAVIGIADKALGE